MATKRPLILSSLIIAPCLMGIDHKKKLMVNTDLFGSYEAKCADQVVTFNLSRSVAIQGIKERLKVGVEENNYIYSKNYSLHNLEADINYPVAITLPTSDLLTSNGMYCSLDILNSSNEVMLTIKFTIYPISVGEIINPMNYSYDSRYKKFKNTVIQIVDNETKSYYESYYFENYLDYFDINYYRQIKLEQFDFIYSCIYQPTYKDAYIEILNPTESFSDLIKNNKCRIPLVANFDSGIVSFKFASPLYTNIYNLKMSLFPQVGYQYTENFYLPVNEKEDVLSFDYQFVIEEFGENKAKISLDLAYLTETNYIGDCQNSYFCIAGGVKR